MTNPYATERESLDPDMKITAALFGMIEDHTSTDGRLDQTVVLGSVVAAIKAIESDLRRLEKRAPDPLSADAVRRAIREAERTDL